MAQLKLDDNYFIETDTNNFTLRFQKVVYDEKKKKDVTKKDEWNYPKLSQAMSKYLNECVRPLETIKEVFSELKRIELLIEKL